MVKTDRIKLAVSITCDAYLALIKLDKSLIGTRNYMGFAAFWHYDYRHYLRGASTAHRVKVHHKLSVAGLPPCGTGPEYDRIISEPIDAKCRMIAAAKVEKDGASDKGI